MMAGATKGVSILGAGVIAANGVGWDDFSNALREGASGVDALVSFDAEDTGRECAAEMPDFDPAPFLRSPKNYLDRNSALAFAACEMAVRRSGVTLPDANLRAGLCLGSAGGNLESLAVFHAKVMEKGPRLAPPFLFPHTYVNTTVGLLGIEYGLSAHHLCFCSGGASGLEAVAAAKQALAQDRADVMIAGGAEAFSEWLFRAALADGLLSPLDGGDEGCRPFGARRNGSVLGEGAALFVLGQADAESAMGRIVGVGVSASPDRAMALALADGDVELESVSAVFAAGGGYAQVDMEEAEAIQSLFGSGGVPVVALKSMVGETLGASGPLNLAAALAAMETDTLPGAITADAELCIELDLVREPRSTRVDTVLINACAPTTRHWVSLVVER